MARYDLKADRKQGLLKVLSCRFEGSDGSVPETAADGEAARGALLRYAGDLGFEPVW